MSSSSFTTSSSLPREDAWLDAYRRLQPRWKSFTASRQMSIPISVSRVNQFDAARLDIEMSAMLKEQLVKVFSLMKPGMLFQHEPELDAFLEFLIWRFSIWVDKPTPGIGLMNLRYRDDHSTEARVKMRTGLEGPGLSAAQKLWYCAATVGGQYFWARLQLFSAFRRWGNSEQRSFIRWVLILVRWTEGLYKAASLGNLLIFLFTGSLDFNSVCWHRLQFDRPILLYRYRNVIERALKARLVYESPNMNRAVSFEYMNRQLVWNEFSPFSKDKNSNTEVSDSICPICQATPSIPFLALPCQHRYCYYCLRTRCAATPSLRCSRCSVPVIAMQRTRQIHRY